MHLNEQLLQLVKIVVPVCAVVYVLISPLVAMPLWNKLLFFPSRGDHESYRIAAIHAVPRQDIAIASSNNSRLHGWLFLHPDSHKIAIINHGNGGSIIHRVQMIEALLSSGVSVLAYDYQGYGKSTGEPTVPNIVADGLAAYDYAHKQLGFAPKDIILAGESLGCGVTTEVALRRPCAALILQSGFSSLTAIAREKFSLIKLYPDFMFPQPLLNNAGNLAGIHVPVLVVHGALDEAIPVAHGKANYAAANQPKTLYLIEEAGHNNCIDTGGPTYQQAFADFIGSLTKQIARK